MKTLILFGLTLMLVVSLILIQICYKDFRKTRRLQTMEWEQFASENKIKISKSTYDLIFHDLFLKNDKNFHIWQQLSTWMIFTWGIAAGSFLAKNVIVSAIFVIINQFLITLGGTIFNRYELTAYHTSQKAGESMVCKEIPFFIADFSLLKQRRLNSLLVLISVWFFDAVLVLSILVSMNFFN